MTSTIPPIPTAALPVVEIIRREVPRPMELPEVEDGSLRWPTPYHILGCCPMGLCSHAVVPQPTSPLGFGYEHVALEAVQRFALWWDRLDPSAAQAAVDAVWPQEEKP